jgi:transposase
VGIEPAKIKQVVTCLVRGKSGTWSPPPGPAPRKPERNQPRIDVRGHLHRILGVDLTVRPGMRALTAHLFFSETGPDLGRFKSSKHFCSWLGLCPDNRVSGGNRLESRTRNVTFRAAYAAGRCHSAIGDFFRRKRAQLGAPEAIIATAHKLARVIHHMIITRTPYDEIRFADQQHRSLNIKTRNLHRQAAALGLRLILLLAQSSTL